MDILEILEIVINHWRATLIILTTATLIYFISRENWVVVTIVFTAIVFGTIVTIANSKREYERSSPFENQDNIEKRGAIL